MKETKLAPETCNSCSRTLRGWLEGSHKCQSKSCSNVNWTTRRIYQILLLLCKWDSHAREKHYVVKTGPKRMSLIPGVKNIKEPLVQSEKIFLPPIHIKLGLMKNLVKAMNKDGGGFQYLKTKFTRISDAKMKEGIFVGPQIRELMKDSNFESTLNEAEQRAWTAFVEVCHNFLGNKKKRELP
ncbi:hypothetical protein EVAR_65373_1 [Eumeta japonica]|uniref:Uncharacterized protein n=1 Tax=Eumeta variegata TaxID=151549 RepID=A0A4C1ZNY3_EUMVA|nr:hypothetical protein EVAR_65373_1 [Eumeta japonica]